MRPRSLDAHDVGQCVEWRHDADGLPAAGGIGGHIEGMRMIPCPTGDPRTPFYGLGVTPKTELILTSGTSAVPVIISIPRQRVIVCTSILGSAGDPVVVRRQLAYGKGDRLGSPGDPDATTRRGSDNKPALKIGGSSTI